MTRSHLTLAALTLSAAALLAACGGASSGSTSSGGLERTGEVNDMGMPVIETPGTASGTATAAGIAMEPASWALGKVPLNIAVRPRWTIRNTGTQAFTISEPRAEVREGCCPGAFTLEGPATVQPGGETGFTFELSMHPGMDGPHDMRVHVPISYADGTTGVVEATVTGDFRD